MRLMSYETHDDEGSFSKVVDDPFRIRAFLYIDPST